MMNTTQLSITALEAQLADSMTRIANLRNAMNEEETLSIQIREAITAAKAAAIIESTDTEIPIADAVAAAVGGAHAHAHAHKWADEILKCLERRQDGDGMTIFGLASLSVRGVKGHLDIGQRERVWAVLQAYCPVRKEDDYGVHLGLPANWQTRYPVTSGGSLDAAIQTAVGGKHAAKWAAAIIRYLRLSSGLTQWSLSQLRAGGTSRRLTGAQLERTWRVLRKRCPEVGGTGTGIALGMPKA